MKPLDLRIHAKHPTVDAYRFGPSYTPYAIVAVDKRFTDAELAAEYHHQRERFYTVHEGYSVTSEGIQLVSPDCEWRRMDTFRRFATLPHYDEADQ